MGSEGYVGKKGMVILLEEKLLCLLHDQMFKERILAMLVYVVKHVMSSGRHLSYITGNWCGTAWRVKASAPRLSCYSAERCPRCKMKVEHKINGPLKDCSLP